MSGILTVANNVAGLKYKAKLTNLDSVNPSVSTTEYIINAYDKNDVLIGGIEMCDPESKTSLTSAYGMKLTRKHSTKDIWAALQIGFVAGDDQIFCNIGGGNLDGVAKINYTNGNSLWIA